MENLNQYLHQGIEVSYWDEAVQEHVIYEGRLLDLNTEGKWMIIKCEEEVLVLDLVNVDNVFLSEHAVPLSTS
tara:strand:+ start:937 stop:1155 length:219 start_codon:yes stop_codon:yes gene_type:complete